MNQKDFKDKSIAEFVEEIKVKGRYISLKSFDVLKTDSKPKTID